MYDPKDWTTVGVTDHPTGSLVSTDIERTNLYMTPAILRRRPRGRVSVTISWQTDDERFVVSPKDDVAYQDGDQTLVLVSTVTSSQRGCHNGHARIVAIQTSPGKWCQV